MDLFFAIFGVGALVLAAISFTDPEARGILKRFDGMDLKVYATLTLAATATSLLAFDTVADHAFRPHEEAYFLALQGSAPPDGFHPLETQTLLRLIYQGVGSLLGSSPSTFVATALLLGIWSVPLLGMAVQLSTRRAWLGYAIATLLAIHPDATYWRGHALQIAPPFSAFALCALLGLVYAKGPNLRLAAGWIGWGTFTLALRPDLLGAVLATSAFPILRLGAQTFLKEAKHWGPLVGIGAVVLAVPTLQNASVALDREDYIWGLRFVLHHLSVPQVFQPISFGGFLLLFLAGVWLSTGKWPNASRQLSYGARAWLIIAAASLLPDLLFVEFGARHLLVTSTAALAVGGCGFAALWEAGPKLDLNDQAERRLRLALLILIAHGTLGCLIALHDQGVRYGDQTEAVPALPGIDRPDRLLSKQLGECGLYAGESWVCDSWERCHPIKDLRDPHQVRRMWDEHDGCVLWAVDDTCDDVSGVMNDWWTMVRGAYAWEPAGLLPVPHRHSHVEVYRLMGRP